MKKVYKTLPLLITSLLLVGCKNNPTPQPEPEINYKAKIKESSDTDVSYLLASDVAVSGEDKTKSISITTYKTKTEDGYLTTDEKIDGKLYLVMKTSKTKSLSDVTVKVKDSSATLKYDGVPSLIGRYYVYEIENFPKTEDFEIVSSFKKNDYISSVTYTKHTTPTTTTNYDDLYVHITLNGNDLKKGDDKNIKVSEMDDVVLAACENEGKTTTSGTLKIDASKGLVFKFFYKKNQSNLNYKIFSFSPISNKAEFARYGDYKEKTYYKNEEEQPYHTLFKFAPVVDGLDLQFNFDYSTTKKTYKLSEKNFTDVNVTGTTIYNKEKTATVDVGKPTIKVNGKEVTQVTLENLNDTNVNQIALTYTKSQIETPGGGDFSKIEGVLFNDDKNYDKKRYNIDTTNNIFTVYLKNITNNPETNLVAQYPFDIAMGSDGYGIVEDNPLDLKISFTRY